MRKVADSASVKLRSTARNSSSSSRARSLPIGIGGSERVEGHCDVARRPFEEEIERVMAAAIRDLLVVVEHEDEVLVERFQVVENSRDDRIHNIRARLTQRTQGGGATFRRCVPDRVNDVAPERDRVVVPESSETQAKGRASTSRHCARRVVFPNPGGAANRTSLRRIAQHVGAARAWKSVAWGANSIKLPLEEGPIVGGTI